MNHPTPVVRELVAFFALACLLSWPTVMLWPSAAPGTTLTAEEVDRAFAIVSFWFAFGPLLSAVAVTWMLRGRAAVWQMLRGFLQWRIPPSCYAAALLVPVTVQVATVVLWTLVTGQPLSPPSIRRVLGNWTAGTIIGGLFLVMEETGWRGFALPRVQRHTNALAAGAVVGLMWSAWHLPLWVAIARCTLPSSAAAVLWITLLVLAIVSFSVLMTWVFNSAGGSLLPMLLMHGSNNASMVLAVGSLPGGGPIGVPFVAALATVLLLVALLVVFRYGPGTLSTRPKAELSA